MKKYTVATSFVAAFASTAFASDVILMDQIGISDGSSIDPSNILANQIFEPAFDVYDIAVVDDFAVLEDTKVTSVEMIVAGWNGYASPENVSGYLVNFYSSVDVAGISLAGDLYSAYFDSADVTINPDWTFAGTNKIVIDLIDGPILEPTDFMYVSIANTLSPLSWNADAMLLSASAPKIDETPTPKAT